MMVIRFPVIRNVVNGTVNGREINTYYIFLRKNAHLKSCQRQGMLLDLKANNFFLMWADELCKL